MKKLIGIVAASSLAIAAIGAPAMAKSDSAVQDGRCFGTVHKLVNAQEAGLPPSVVNVGVLVQDVVEDKGQGKKAVAQSFCPLS